MYLFYYNSASGSFSIKNVIIFWVVSSCAGAFSSQKAFFRFQEIKGGI